ncbi:hypothetical protein ZWY2020_012506 [Hordeum vulgare]|nr:hypothetical protein ZWY2020_012506 [Hordeum vulgare]
MVKGRTGQRVKLYVRGSILGFKRSKSNQYQNTSLMRPLPLLVKALRLFSRIATVAQGRCRRRLVFTCVTVYTVVRWYKTRGTRPTAGSRPRRRRGVQYYSSASISIARTDILNVSRSASSMELATGAMELAPCCAASSALRGASCTALMCYSPSSSLCLGSSPVISDLTHYMEKASYFTNAEKLKVGYTSCTWIRRATIGEGVWGSEVFGTVV